MFALVFLSVLCYVASCAAEQTCNEVQCKLQPVEDDMVSEFHSKASEKGVRLVYLNLEIGNDTYHPLELQDEFLPERWVWAKSIEEPMLSLPFDYDILSLGLLNYQVRSMPVRLEDQPSGCLASLNSSCQNMVVGKALLNIVSRNVSGESSLRKDVVCVAMIVKDEDTGYTVIDYRCCRPNAALIRCGLRVKLPSSRWYESPLYLVLLSLLLYWPALFLLLPDCVFNLQRESEKEDRMEQQLANYRQAGSTTNQTRNGHQEISVQNVEDDRLAAEQIPVDDASPVSCLTFLRRCLFQHLPGVSFNIKLGVLESCIIPLVFYVQMGLYFTLKQKYLQESLLKSPPELSLTGLLQPPFFKKLYDYTFYIFLTLWALTCLMSILFLRPRDFLLQEGLRRPCCLCTFSAKVFAKLHGESHDLPLDSSSHSLSDEMLRHLKILQQWLCLWMFFLKPRNRFSSGFLELLQSVTYYPLMSYEVARVRKRRPLSVLWSLLSIYVGALLVGLFVVLYLSTAAILFVLCSPFAFLLCIAVRKHKLDERVRQRRAHTSSDPDPSHLSLIPFACCLIIILPPFIAIYAVFLGFALNAFILSSASFIVTVIEFTVMGLVLNADIVSPYVVFSGVVATNIYLCYANFQNRCKEVKGFILHYWKRESQVTSIDQDTIPTKLYWFVCDKVFPIENEICLMFRNMALIVTFLFIVLSSIIFFGDTFNISAVVSTIAVFATGTISGWVFNRLTKENNFKGWGKIKIKREIKKAVEEFRGEIINVGQG